MIRCTICQDDGWLAYPTWADAAKTTIRIRKVRCASGHPFADPDEPGVLPAFPRDEERREKLP